MKLLRHTQKMCTFALYRNEAHDIFGSQNGDTNVTITSDRNMYFLFLEFKLKMFAKGAVEYQIHYIHIHW